MWPVWKSTAHSAACIPYVFCMLQVLLRPAQAQHRACHFHDEGQLLFRGLNALSDGLDPDAKVGCKAAARPKPVNPEMEVLELINNAPNSMENTALSQKMVLAIALALEHYP